MPELPEVETVRRGLDKLVVGKSIFGVEIINHKSFAVSDSDLKKFVQGAEMIATRRRGKVLIIDLSSGYSLVVHLKMTGQMVFRGEESWAAGHPNSSFIAKLPDKSTRVVFGLSGDAKLYFNDQRKFGWIKLIPTAEVENIELLSKMGPEPFEKGVEKIFINNLRRHQNSMIKPAILNQTVIAGIGNIYADESLWLAKVHPEAPVKNLTDKKLAEICRAAGDIMQKSIDSGGSTMKNYVKADGNRGDYLEKFAKVFRRDGMPCPRCGTTIAKIKVAGRGTHICPKCQKLK
jgi:formamidopyrimidine-DNA glycosylase